MRPTKRQLAASMLIVAAAEVGSAFDSTTTSGQTLSVRGAELLRWLHAAVEEWRETQSRSKKREPIDPVFADVDAKRDLESTAPRPLMASVLARRERKAAR